MNILEKLDTIEYDVDIAMEAKAEIIKLRTLCARVVASMDEAYDIYCDVELVDALKAASGE